MNFDIKDAREKGARAFQELCVVCRNNFTMKFHIPAMDYDSDLLFSEAFDSLGEACCRIEFLEAKCAAMMGALKEAAQSADSLHTISDIDPESEDWATIGEIRDNCFKAIANPDASAQALLDELAQSRSVYKGTYTPTVTMAGDTPPPDKIATYKKISGPIEVVDVGRMRKAMMHVIECQRWAMDNMTEENAVKMELLPGDSVIVADLLRGLGLPIGDYP